MDLEIQGKRSQEKKMTTFNLVCPFPVDPVHVFLFTEVSNTIEIRSQLLNGDPNYLYAFLDADLVTFP